MVSKSILINFQTQRIFSKLKLVILMPPPWYRNWLLVWKWSIIVIEMYFNNTLNSLYPNWYTLFYRSVINTYIKMSSWHRISILKFPTLCWNSLFTLFSSSFFLHSSFSILFPTSLNLWVVIYLHLCTYYPCFATFFTRCKYWPSIWDLTYI